MTKKINTPMVFMQDDSSHWYLIPAKDCKKFHELCRKVEEEGDDDACCELEKKFSKYRCNYPGNYVILEIEER